MSIGEVLSRAWQIIWKHKVLWIFGILASCSSGGAGAGGPSINYSYGGNDLPPGLERSFNQIFQMPDWQIFLIIGAFILVILLLIALAVFLGTMGKIGLILGTQQAEHGVERLSFGALFRGGLPYFWRVFALNLLVGIAIFLFFMMVILVGVFGTVLTLGLALLCLIPLFCIMVPLTWFVSVIIEQANAAIVLENLGIMVGLQRGWEVVRANLGTMIVMALVLMLGVGGILGFIIAMPIFLIVIPVIIGAVSQTREMLWGGLVITGLCFVVYLPILIVLNGTLKAYIGSAWALTFLRLTQPPSALDPIQELTLENA